MSQKAIHRILVMCVFAVLTVGFCSAQEHAGVVGKWNMISESSADPVHWTFVVKEVDGKLAGFITTDESEQPAKDFTYEGGVIKFKAPYQGQDYDIELKVTGAKVDGTWSGGGDSGRTYGTKAQ